MRMGFAWLMCCTSFSLSCPTRRPDSSSMHNKRERELVCIDRIDSLHNDYLPNNGSQDRPSSSVKRRRFMRWHPCWIIPDSTKPPVLGYWYWGQIALYHHHHLLLFPIFSLFQNTPNHTHTHTPLLNDGPPLTLLWTLYQSTIQQGTANCPTSPSHVNLSTDKRREASGKWNTPVPFIHYKTHWHCTIALCVLQASDTRGYRYCTTRNIWHGWQS